MVNFFIITISLLFSLFVISVVLGVALFTYVLDSVAITIGDSFLDDSRKPLRDFLNIVVSPLFVLIVLVMVTAMLIGLLSKKLRPKINERSYRLRRDPMSSTKVTVALTAYNEEDVIGKCVSEFISNKLVTNVIVIDNGSTDNTLLVSKNAGANVIHVEKNQGFGYACLRGLRESLQTDADVIILCEGDNTQSGFDVGKLLSYIENCDMVVGTRTVRALTEENTQMSQFYIWGNYFIAFLICLKYFSPIDLTYVRLTDVGCVFRAIRRDSLERIIDKLETKGHLFSPHMILVAIENNLSVVEVPITFRKREGYSKGAGGKKTLGFKVGLQMIWEIVSR